MKVSPLKSLLLLAPAIAPSFAASDNPRPRGVGPEFAKFYKSADTFKCIGNPAIEIPFSQVNDDYCDCPDGSDEPGTSACSYISAQSPPTIDNNKSGSLPGFYCKNKGHNPSYIPFTHVNDGICDYDLCCDGSDEFAGVGGVQCPDKCKEIGKEWKKQDEARKKSLIAANKKRRQLIAEATKLKQDIEARVKTLKTEIEADEINVKFQERTLEETRRKEQNKLAKKTTPIEDKVRGLITLSKRRIDELYDRLKKQRASRDELRDRVAKLEEILTSFKSEYNPNFNDEGVKRAVQAWENYAATSGNYEQLNQEVENDLNAILQEDEDRGLVWADYERLDYEPEAVTILNQLAEYLPVSLRTYLWLQWSSLKGYLVENGILASVGVSENEDDNAEIKKAKDALFSAENSLRDHKKELGDKESDLQKDYGPESVFRALKGQCVSHESGEYTYEMCWLDKTKQKPRKGGSDTTMGNFVSIESLWFDEDLPSNGKGVGVGQRHVLKYENGAHCWNGPNRSTTVVLVCAEKDEIWKTVEEEKCVYRMEVGTPAVCDWAATAGVADASGAAGKKDEL